MERRRAECKSLRHIIEQIIARLREVEGRKHKVFVLTRPPLHAKTHMSAGRLASPGVVAVSSRTDMNNAG